MQNKQQLEAFYTGYVQKTAMNIPPVVGDAAKFAGAAAQSTGSELLRKLKSVVPFLKKVQEDAGLTGDDFKMVGRVLNKTKPSIAVGAAAGLPVGAALGSALKKDEKPVDLATAKV